MKQYRHPAQIRSAASGRRGTFVSAKVPKTIPPKRGVRKPHLSCALPSLRSSTHGMSLCRVWRRRHPWAAPLRADLAQSSARLALRVWRRREPGLPLLSLLGCRRALERASRVLSAGSISATTTAMSMNSAITHEQAEALVGKLALLFSYSEQALEFVCSKIMLKHDSKSIVGWPAKRLEQKITYLRRAANEFPSLAAHKEFMLRVADKFDSLAEIRHGFIHGTLRSDPLSNGLLIFRKYEVKNDKFIEKELTIEWKNSDNLIKEFLDLEVESGALMAKILQIV